MSPGAGRSRRSSAVVMEAYVNGVSTRKVDRLVEQLGIEGMTKDRVSAICRGLDEQVELFRHRPLEGAYPYLWLDAKHFKVRDHGRVVSKALVVAYAVHESGVREVIGLDIGEVESGSFWVEFLRALKKRGPDRRPARDLRSARRAQARHRPGAGLPVAALHRPLRQRHARALPPRPARPGLRRPQGGLQRRGPRPGPRPRRPRAQASRAGRPEGLPAARGRRGGPHRVLPAPAQSTGPSCAPPTRWSASTKRSAAALTSSGSSPTTPPRSASPARCSPNKTMNGSSNAAISPSSR